MSGYFHRLETLGSNDRVLLFVGQRLLVKDGEFLWQVDQISKELFAKDTLIKVSHGHESFLATQALEGAEQSGGGATRGDTGLPAVARHGQLGDDTPVAADISDGVGLGLAWGNKAMLAVG